MSAHRAALTWLRDHDPMLGSIIDAQPAPDLMPHSDYFAALVSSIISQQLSVKAASTIKQRVWQLFGGEAPTPEAVLLVAPDALRACGLSQAKTNYIRDLAEHILDGRVQFAAIAQQSNTEIISELTDVKGIGEWTVHMFLIFCVGRLDVLATGDLGVRSAIRNLYGLAELPSPAQVAELATEHHWHPYESIACWYLWRALDNAPS